MVLRTQYLVLPSTWYLILVVPGAQMQNRAAITMALTMTLMIKPGIRMTILNLQSTICNGYWTLISDMFVERHLAQVNKHVSDKHVDWLKLCHIISYEAFAQFFSVYFQCSKCFERKSKCKNLGFWNLPLVAVELYMNVETETVVCTVYHFTGTSKTM